MRAARRLLVAGIGLAGALSLQCIPASACSPVPAPAQEPSESDTAYSERVQAFYDRTFLESQQQAWDNASSVAVVRITRVKPYRSGRYADQQGAFVSTERWLKGDGGRVGFEFKPIGMCLAENDVATGEPGETYIVYFSRGRPSPKTLTAAWTPDMIQDVRVPIAR